MASPPTKLLALFFLSSLILLQGSKAEIICEELPTEKCSFSVSGQGKRCVLEKFTTASEKFQCKTSDVVVERMANYIETDACVQTCGVDRNSVGISSDALFENQFTAKLCASACFENCPNIVNLYDRMAAGEGSNLAMLCEKQRRNPRRDMVELSSYGAGAAAGPSGSASPRRGMGELSGFGGGASSPTGSASSLSSSSSGYAAPSPTINAAGSGPSGGAPSPTPL